MRVHVGCEFTQWAFADVHALVQVEPRPDADVHTLSESWDDQTVALSSTYRDQFGNTVRRLTFPPGRSIMRYDAMIEVERTPDPAAFDAAEVRPADLPPETLVFSLPSRFCPSDELANVAGNMFGALPPGWSRVQAICDWVHDNIQFGYSMTHSTKTAADVFQSRQGVCRDFAHLAVTFCRALNIPARYVFGYLPDIDILPTDAVMDFCAWIEVYLGGQWWTFDPRNNTPRVGRVLIGRGRDALDVAMVTSFGALQLESMVVWADEVPEV